MAFSGFGLGAWPGAGPFSFGGVGSPSGPPGSPAAAAGPVPEEARDALAEVLLRLRRANRDDFQNLFTALTPEMAERLPAYFHPISLGVIGVRGISRGRRRPPNSDRLISGLFAFFSSSPTIIDTFLSSFLSLSFSTRMCLDVLSLTACLFFNFLLFVSFRFVIFLFHRLPLPLCCCC